MATPALRQFEGSHPSMYISDALTGFLPATSQPTATAVPRQPVDLRVPKDALSGAKGVIVALGLEIGAAMLLYSVWLIWHLIR
jgi:hypothetical protein